MKRVGFVGLGDIGAPMAKSLCGAFDEVRVFDLRPEAMEALGEAGAAPAQSCRELAAHSELVGVCVVDDAGTEAVVGELLAGATPGTVIALHSTISPGLARDLAAAAGRRQVALLDAPMTGGAQGAVERKLRFMVGGDAALFERVRPYLERMGDRITHCGPVGSGAVAKLCNNLVQYQAWLAYVEAEALAEGAGLAKEKLHEVLAWILNDNARAMLAGRAALVAQPDHAYLRGRFETVRALAEKDLGLALEVARKAGIAMPGTELCVEELARIFGLAR